MLPVEKASHQTQSRGICVLPVEKASHVGHPSSDALVIQGAKSGVGATDP